MTIADRVANITPSMTLEITAKAKKMKEEGLPVISFGAGEPDFNTPDYIIEAAKVALDKGMTKYTPASGTADLKAAICNKLKKDNGLSYEPSQIIVSNGAKHALYNAFLAILNSGDEVIIPAPYWLTYPELVKLCGGVPVYVDTKAENGFKLTADELKAAITPRTKAIIINDPNNPSGAVYTKDELWAIAKVVSENPMYIISDEIYEKLVYNGEHFSIANYSSEIKDLTILVNGVSKTYSMTGWRIGYTASNKRIASAISAAQSHCTSNPNSIAQYATLAALLSDKGDEFLKGMLTEFDARRKLIEEELTKSGIDFVRPDGAFYVFVSVKQFIGKSYDGAKIDSARTLANLLIEKANTAVIPCEGFGAPDYIRLSYAISREDISQGLKNITEFTSKLK